MGREPVYTTTPVMQNSRSVLLPLPSVNSTPLRAFLLKDTLGRMRRKRTKGGRALSEMSLGWLPLIWAPSSKQGRKSNHARKRIKGERDGERERERKMIFLINSRACQKAEEMRASERWKRRA